MKLQTSGVLGTSYAIAKLAQKRADQIKSSMKFGDLKDNIEIIEVLKFERGSWKKIQ